MWTRGKGPFGERATEGYRRRLRLTPHQLADCVRLRITVLGINGQLKLAHGAVLVWTAGWGGGDTERAEGDRKASHGDRCMQRPP